MNVTYRIDYPGGPLYDYHPRLTILANDVVQEQRKATILEALLFNILQEVTRPSL